MIFCPFLGLFIIDFPLKVYTNALDFLPNKIDVFLKNLHLTSILDYGAGLGRNLPMLQKYSCDIVDYIELTNYKNKFSEYENGILPLRISKSIIQSLILALTGSLKAAG